MWFEMNITIIYSPWFLPITDLTHDNGYHNPSLIPIPFSNFFNLGKEINQQHSRGLKIGTLYSKLQRADNHWVKYSWIGVILWWLIESPYWLDPGFCLHFSGFLGQFYIFTRDKEGTNVGRRKKVAHCETVTKQKSSQFWFSCFTCCHDGFVQFNCWMCVVPTRILQNSTKRLRTFTSDLNHIWLNLEPLTLK